METLDPEIKQFAESSRHVSLDREYVAEEDRWGGPVVYLYNGLVLQARVFDNPERLKDVMLRNLSNSMLRVDETGGIRSPEHMIGNGWAYGQTKNRLFAETAWDVARGHALFMPELPLDQPEVPYIPYTLSGSSLVRMHLMPMLVGVSLAGRAGLDMRSPWRLNGLMIYLEPENGRKGPYGLTVFVRPEKDGDLTLRLTGQGRGETPIVVTVLDADGAKIAEADVPPKGPPQWPPYLGDVTIPNARRNATYRVRLTNESRCSAGVLGDAKIVFHLPAGVGHSNEPASGGQSYTPQTMSLRAVADEVAFVDRRKKPFAMRDAETGALLARPDTYAPEEFRAEVKPGQMIEIVLRGCRSLGEWRFSGCAPYAAATADQWFNPEEK
jgi:hypothetical protein